MPGTGPYEDSRVPLDPVCQAAKGRKRTGWVHGATASATSISTIPWLRVVSCRCGGRWVHDDVGVTEVNDRVDLAAGGPFAHGVHQLALQRFLLAADDDIPLIT